MQVEIGSAGPFLRLEPPDRWTDVDVGRRTGVLPHVRKSVISIA